MLLAQSIYCLLELNMLWECVTRGYGDHSPLTTAAIVEWRRRSAGGRAAVVCPMQQGGGQVGLVVPEDVGPAEAETVILPRTPDEALVVDVARGLDSGSMIEQSHCIFMQVSYSVGLLLDVIRRGLSPECWIVGGFYSEGALRNEKQKAQCIPMHCLGLNTSYDDGCLLPVRAKAKIRENKY